MGLFVLSRGKANKLNRLWFFFTVSVAVWGFGAFWIALENTEMTALLAWRLSYALGVVWIPILFYQFVLTFCELQNKRLLLINYGVGVLFFPVIIFSPFFMGNVRFVFSSFYYFTPGSYLFHTYLAWWMWLTIYSHYIVLKSYRCASTLRRNQFKYFLVAFSLAYSMGSLAYLPGFGIDIYPYGTFGIVFYPIIMTYAIGAYRLMDIQTVIHKTAMWAVLSSLILLPICSIFYLGHHLIIRLNPLQMSLLIAAIVLVLIPYITAVQPRIDHLFQRRKHDLQKILHDFIYEISALKGVHELLEKLQTTIISALYTENMSFILFNVKAEDLTPFFVSHLHSPFSSGRHNNFLKWLERKNDIIEIDFMNEDPQYSEIRESANSYFQAVNGRLVIPFIHDKKLLGVLNLDRKKNLKPYTEHDLRFLFGLKAEASISLSNALLYDDVTKMSLELKQWANDLERKVEERTEELEENKKDLQMTNRRLENALSEVKRVGRDLAHAEKMSSLGVLVAGVAHELNNPISFSKGSLLYVQRIFDTLLREPIRPEALSEKRNDLHESLGIVKMGLTRMEEIVRNLSSFIRKDDLGFTSVDIHAGLDITLEFLKYEWKPGIVVHRDYVEVGEYASLQIEAVHGQIHQVFTNILQNALHTMSDGGEIFLKTSCDDNEVSISIRDTGSGIPEENMSKIFEPFFTTKEVGQGTGLGLPLAHKMIVETHHGRIDVKSKIGEGTEFIITLPMKQPISKGSVYAGITSV
jgi:signal transduction histidine kinase